MRPARCWAPHPRARALLVAGGRTFVPMSPGGGTARGPAPSWGGHHTATAKSQAKPRFPTEPRISAQFLLPRAHRNGERSRGRRRGLPHAHAAPPGQRSTCPRAGGTCPASRPLRSARWGADGMRGPAGPEPWRVMEAALEAFQPRNCKHFLINGTRKEKQTEIIINGRTEESKKALRGGRVSFFVSRLPLLGFFGSLHCWSLILK